MTTIQIDEKDIKKWADKIARAYPHGHYTVMKKFVKILSYKVAKGVEDDKRN